MYRTKKDVDTHVESLISKVSLKEFTSRAHSIARLYFDVGDYASCKKYVERYIAHKENNAAAHKLLGQALEKLGLKDKALEEYQISYNLEPSQTSLVLDICRLLADNDIVVDPGKKKYWCDRAEIIFPKHAITLQLREQLVSNDPRALLELLKSELAAQPKDAILHARLLRHYMQYNMYREAFEHGINILFNGNMLFNNIAWYEMLNEVLKQQPKSELKSWRYNLLLLTVHENLCSLSLTETPSSNSKSITEIRNYLIQYDQAIETVFKNGTPAGFAEFNFELLKHHRGQFAFHFATFLLKQCKKDELNWRDAVISISPLMLIAWHTVPLASDVKWLKQAPEIQHAAVRRWYLEGTFRCSQSGHCLLAYEKKISIIDEASKFCSGSNWKDKLYKKIFTDSDKIDKDKSHFVTNKSMEIVLTLPNKAEVEKFDGDAQKFFPNSLHHFIWILLNYKDISIFNCTIFDMLTTKLSNYPSCGPESLNKLDILAFLYCSTLTAKDSLGQNAYKPEFPALLPANITDLLCTLTQMKWWDCAYKFAQNELSTDLTDVRTTLTRGIEVVRCVDNHGLDPRLLYELAHIFMELSKTSANSAEKSSFCQRAQLYLSTAVPLLKKIQKNVTIVMPEKRMFEYVRKDLCEIDMNILIEDSQLILGLSYLNENKLEKAIEMLRNLKSPKASFYLCQIYKKMALDEYKINGENMTTDVKLKYISLMNKAKNCANLTIHKLANIAENNDNVFLLRDTKEILEEIEINLSKLQNNDFNFVDMSGDGNASLVDSEEQIQQTNYRNLISTPKHGSLVNLTNYRSVVDSQMFDSTRVENKVIEKIDTQIRTLQRRDATMNNFMEQTKNWIDENRNLGNQIIMTINTNIQNTIDQFRLLKLSVDQVKDEIIECRTECKDVADLRKEVAELKKEIDKLKKCPPEPNVEENSYTYNVEEQYRNNNAPTFSPNLPLSNTPLVPPYNQRLTQPFSMPLSPYQLCQQNLFNMYNQYSQLAQAAPQPIFDPSRQPVNFPSVYLPTPEQVYADMANFIPQGVVPTVNPPSTSTAPIITVPTPKPAPNLNSENLDKKLPENVVITSSDPLPTYTTVPAPVHSVIIPPEHIKSTPHNYQIQMPPATSSFSSFNSNTTGNIGTGTFSWNTDIATVTQSFGNIGPKTTPKADNSVINLSETFGNNTSTSFNKSRTLSEKSNTSVENYDPYPDFKPIIPLPDEVTVTTGEEDEKPIFSARAKLFRFADKQWKERGIGEIKLLEHKITQKVRVLMRRDQVHKICANHIIAPDMKIEPMKNEPKAYIWVANDFADENVVLEKFCIRFKTADIGESFYEAFQNSVKKASIEAIEDKPLALSKKEIEKPKVLIEPNNTSTPKTDSQSTKTVLGGFTFSSTPTFKNVKDDDNQKSNITENKTTKVNPFNNVTLKTDFTALSNIFNKNTSSVKESDDISKKDYTIHPNISDVVEEFEPTVEFKPIIPLPALVEKITGEENEIVLFEHRAKLLRFDSSTKEWKERGLGNIKLLANKENKEKIRLLMRRDQVMNICCNHFVTKDIIFQKMLNNNKAVTWCAKDFSEGELKTETFCLRFKTSEILDKFMEAIKLAQKELESTKSEIPANVTAHIYESGFGDNFKPKPGSWQCDGCYTNNLDSFLKCACCEQLKPLNNNTNNDIPQTKSVSWGNQFKTKPGTWECSHCYVRNEKESNFCTVCNNPKDLGTKPTPENGVVGVNLSIGSSKISNEVKVEEKSGWGDKFKPKANTWECQHCLVYNEGSITHCSACNNPKDPSVQKINTTLFGNVSTAKSKFTFGIPQNNTTENKTENAPSIFDGTGSHKILFGTQTSNNSSIKGGGFTFNMDANKALSTVNDKVAIVANNTDLNKPALLPTPPNDSVPTTAFGSSSTFSFVFKTPVKGKSPSKPKSDKEDSDDNECVSDDEGHHIHFSPVIPLPDKVDVITGEEEENELYAHRAKLYIFTDSEWKERGIGTIKILQHKETGKYRVLMRREQVHKICLNYALTTEVKHIVKDEKSWMFVVNDFSEGEISLTKFCIRFASATIATEFKTKIDEIQDLIKNPKEENGVHDDKQTQDETDDVVFVGEIKPTPEELAKAKALMLPENFFVNVNKKPCPGCRGCKDDETEDLDNTLVSTPSKSEASTISPTNSAYATPTNSNKTMDNSIFRTPLLNVSQNTQTKNLFKSIIESKENNTTPNKSVASNIFASVAQNNNQNNQKSIFGSTNVKSESVNVFGNLGSKVFGAPFSFSGNGKKDDQDKPTSVFGGNFNMKPDGEAKLLQAAWPKPIEQTVVQKTENIFTTKSAPTTVPLKIDENLTFEALSAGNTGFGIEKQSENFKWKDAGQQVFGKVVNKADDSETAEADQSTEDYDPHYEPIIPLPKEIVVSTGEEDEECLFEERSKVFRYNDTKEWKERGVGEMKILYHPERKTYRLLLRREKVHKPVLNTLLHIDFELLPMKNSETAWTWSCRNFAENPEGELETLAVKFKNTTLTSAFRDKVVECVRKLQSLAAQAINQKTENKQSVPSLQTPKPVELAAVPSNQTTLAAKPVELAAVLSTQTSLAAKPVEFAASSLASAAASETKTATPFVWNSTAFSGAFKPNTQTSVNTMSSTNPTPFVWNTEAISGALNANALSKYREHEAEDDDDEEDEEDDDDVEEEEYEGDYDRVYFLAEAQVLVNSDGQETAWEQAQVQLFHDQAFEAKLSVTDLATGEILCDMIVDDYMVMEMNGESVTWTSTDCLTNLAKKVTATFQSVENAENFYDAYETCKVTYEEEA